MEPKLTFNQTSVNINTNNIITNTSSKVYVDTTANGDNSGDTWNNAVNSIKKALELVEDNGTIILQQDTYTGIENTKLTIDKNVNIIGTGRKYTVIDAQKQGYIFFMDNKNLKITLDNITFKEGSGYYSIQHRKGGALFNVGNQLNITNCTFKENHVSLEGGAIYNDGGKIKIEDCIFENNTAQVNGGTIFNNEGSIHITESDFMHNKALYGKGGLAYNNISNLTITNSNIIHNTSDDGGAIFNNKGKLILIKDNISENIAKTGGAIFNNYLLHMKACTLVNNIAKHKATVLFNMTGSIITLDYNWWGSNSPNWTEILSDYSNAPKCWVMMDFTNTSPLKLNDNVEWTVTLNQVEFQNGDIQYLPDTIELPETDVIYQFNEDEIVEDTLVNGTSKITYPFNKDHTQISATINGFKIKLSFKA